MCKLCTRCGSKELTRRGNYIGCLFCGKWCWKLVSIALDQKVWVEVEKLPD